MDFNHKHVLLSLSLFFFWFVKYIFVFSALRPVSFKWPKLFGTNSNVNLFKNSNEFFFINTTWLDFRSTTNNGKQKIIARLAMEMRKNRLCYINFSHCLLPVWATAFPCKRETQNPPSPGLAFKRPATLPCQMFP